MHPLLLIAAAGSAAIFAASRTDKGGALVARAADSAFIGADIAAGALVALVTSRGYRNNNPGNIRFIAKNPWNGQVGNDNGYGIYDTPANGTRALGRQLLAYEARGINTIRGIISTWAPSIENNVGAYIAHVCAYCGIEADSKLNVRAVLPALASAIALHENGARQSWGDQFNAWVYL